MNKVIYHPVSNKFDFRCVLCPAIALVILLLLYFADMRGMVINDVKIPFHNLYNYKSIVESTTVIDPVINDNNFFSGVFTPVVNNEFNFDIYDIFSGRINIDCVYVFDIDQLQNSINAWNKSAIKTQDAYIDVVTGDVVPEVYGTEINADDFINSLDGISIIDIQDFYIKPSVVSSDLESKSLLFKEYQNWQVAYKDMDDVFDVPKDSVRTTRDGNIYFYDLSFIDDIVDSVDDFYSDYGFSRKFLSHSGNLIDVDYKGFGNTVDLDAEKSELRHLFMNHESVRNRVPIYSRNDGILGGDYVEVSINDQHVWHWHNGEVISESDCVTGCVANKHNTPTGVYRVYSMQKGKMLYPKGATKGSWVDRWMPFTSDGCGLHDASWRGNFGGSIYKTSGSHGCVNLPKKYAFQLYDEIKQGIPVVVY